MADNTRRKQWTGGLSSIAGQVALFIPVDMILGHWISALTILFINIYFASQYKNTNPYVTGARWGTLMSLGLVSVARHAYWYPAMLASYTRLGDSRRPLSWNTLLCQGTTEATIITVSTSLLVLYFYFLTPKWPEWTDRWEMLRRAPYSASLGFQTIIVVAVVYPTPLTLTVSLFFAGIISPIIRRQVRLNHIVFLMMTPLFSVGVPELALFWGFVCGLIFLYWASVERSMTAANAAFSFFNGITLLALSLSTVKSLITNSSPAPQVVGFASLVCLAIFMAASYWLLVKNQDAVITVRRVAHGVVPKAVSNHSWWHIRDLWVDREVAHRAGKLFKWKEQDKNIGLFIFGPKYWADRETAFDRVPFARINLTASVLVLTIYAFFQAVDSVLFLTNGVKIVTLTGLAVGFLIILGAPIWLLAKQLQKDSGYGGFSKATSGLALVVLGLYMATIFYFGTTSTTGLNTAAENLEARTGQTTNFEGVPEVIEGDCTRRDQEKPLGLPGKDGF